MKWLALTLLAAPAPAWATKLRVQPAGLLREPTTVDLDRVLSVNSPTVRLLWCARALIEKTKSTTKTAPVAWRAFFYARTWRAFFDAHAWRAFVDAHAWQAKRSALVECRFKQ